MIKIKELESYKDGLSVVIVTYNGKSRLRETLIHLSKQQNIDFNVELLLIDNNSTDGTVTFCNELWQSLGNPFTLRPVVEEKQGTMNARRRGIEECTYRYMLYCDDDNWLNPNYFNISYHLISKDETISALGGKGIITCDEDVTLPFWMDEFKGSYGAGQQSGTSGDITNKKGCLYTAGTTIDLYWLKKLYDLGFKSTLDGRVKNTLVAGEDTELTYALKLIGAKLYYNDKLTFKHYMPKNRLNWDYLKRLWFAFGYANHVISPYNYFFTKKAYPSKLSSLISSFYKVCLLQLKCILKSSNEGDLRVLLLVRAKGELKGVMQRNHDYKANIKMIKTLTTNTVK